MSEKNESIRLVGHLTADPTLRYTPQGVAVANFTIGVNASYPNGQGGFIARSKFVKVACWRDLAEKVTKILHKGDQVMVEGEFSVEEWQTNAKGEKTANGPKVFTGQDGVTRANFEVTARSVWHLAKDNVASASTGPAASAGPDEEDQGAPAPVVPPTPQGSPF